MTKLLAVIIVIVWAIIGIIGGMRARENRVNIEMIIFISCAPFLAFLELLL
jgi:hypothetical protein